MIDGRNFFDQPITSMKIFKKLLQVKEITKQVGCFLDYSYFEDRYKMIAIYLSKQQSLDANRRANQQINFSANSDRDGNTTMFFFIKETKETVLDFSQGTVKGL